jgi:putative transposase
LPSVPQLVPWFGMHHENRSRPRRSFNEPGHGHELTFSCYRRFRVLTAERTCRWLAEAIERARTKQDFALWAFVFMPEHVHLVIRPRQPVYAISAILQSIKQPVGQRAVRFHEANAPQWLPRITRHRGGSGERLFWQSGGGYDRNIDEPKTLRAMIDYVHLNPVRRGWVERAADWRWSSAGWYEGTPTVGLIPDPIPRSGHRSPDGPSGTNRGLEDETPATRRQGDRANLRHGWFLRKGHLQFYPE